MEIEQEKKSGTEQAIEAIAELRTRYARSPKTRYLMALCYAGVALRAQQERENPRPLSLEQLKERDWQAIWIVPLTDDIKRTMFPYQKNGFWDIFVSGEGWDEDILHFKSNDFNRNDYGKTYICYDYEPRGEKG